MAHTTRECWHCGELGNDFDEDGHCEYCNPYQCGECGQMCERINDADQCDACHEKWCAEQIAYWRPLYEGEKCAGLLPEGTDR